MASSTLRALVALSLTAVAACAKIDNASFCCVDRCEEHGASAPVACENSKFVCEASTFTCVDPSNGGRCDRVEDCASSTVTPYCDTTSHTCKQCVGAMGCSAVKPVCGGDGACSACAAEGDCDAYAPEMRPHCAMSGDLTGQCVQCRDKTDCTSGSPVCDAGTCRACRADDECESSACDTASGACIAATNVIYMAPGGTGTTCAMTSPCPTFALALAQVGPSRKTIKMAAGSYVEQVAIADKNVAIHGDGADLHTSSVGPIFTITGTSNVRIEGLRIHEALGASGDGVQCHDANGNSPTVTLARTSIDRNSGVGVNATKCNVVVQRSKLVRNTLGGLVVSTATFDVSNNFVSGNGTTSSTAGGVSFQNISNTGTHTFQFNSVTSNVSSNAATSGVDCVLVTLSLTFGNSIVYGNVGGNGKQVSTTNCSWTFSDLGDGTTGTGDVNTDPQFANASQDDLHLMGTSPVKNAGETTTSITVDIDGDPRSDGMPDIGADELP